MYSTCTEKDLVAPHPRASSPRCLRRPGDEGARRLGDALAQLKNLKELKVQLQNNNIGAGPRPPTAAAESMEQR